MPIQVYKYPLDPNFHGLDPDPVYYIYLDKYIYTYRGFHTICTLTPSSKGKFTKVGLHMVDVEPEQKSEDAIISIYFPNGVQDVIRTINVAIDKLKAVLPDDVACIGYYMIETAHTVVDKMRSTRLSEIQSSCAQRSIARAWRKCVSDPNYKVCIKRLQYEFASF